MDFAEIGKRVLRAEAESLFAAADKIGHSFSAAIELILAGSEKVIFSGLGKSGIVARKIASTFCSTGTPAVFLHPVEALHGDLGVVIPGDVVVLVSRSGSACVINPDGLFVGVITDGDLRRAFQRYDKIDGLTARDLMTASPITIGPDSSLAAALVLMEDRSSRISVLPVVQEDGKCLGLLRLHDVYRPERAG